MVAVLALSALAVVAVQAGAAAPAASNTKLCNALTHFSSTSTDLSTKAGRSAYAARIKQAAKSAPANVKSALNKIASLTGKASSPADVRALVTNKDYQKATGVVASYFAKCVGGAVPTT
jgi:hypothetical protein